MVSREYQLVLAEQFLRQSKTRTQYHSYELEEELSSRIIPRLGLLFDDSFSGLVNVSVEVFVQDDPLFRQGQGTLCKQLDPVIALTRGKYASINTPETFDVSLADTVYCP